MWIVRKGFTEKATLESTPDRGKRTSPENIRGESFLGSGKTVSAKALRQVHA